MAAERLNQLRALMQQENIQADTVAQKQIVLDPAPVSQHVLKNKLEENYSSSDDGYAVRRTVQEAPRERNYNPKTLPDLASVVDADEENRSVGQLTQAGNGFCPVLAAAKYPYKFLKESAKIIEQVSSYFAAEKFWDRKWTIHYIHPPAFVSIKPLHLVPASEFELLLSEINKDTGLKLRLPARAAACGFYVDFTDDGQPRPRFLGISSSKMAFNAMVKQTPAEDFLVKGARSLALSTDDRSYEAFKVKMETALMATKAKAKASKEKKKAQRVQQKDAMCRQLRRTQRYLGLRPRSNINKWSTPSPPSCDVPGQSWSDYLVLKEEFDQKHQEVLPLLELEIPAPYTFDHNVVFVCVDVESFERNHGLITEIGISSLDTNDLSAVPPGVNGTTWMTKINSRHFRIQENRHLVNKDFIVGCPDRFEKAFGESEFISIKEAPKVVGSCFRPPFAARGAGVESTDTQIPKRNIILVGHDTKTDVQYLRDLGYDIGNLSNMLEALDTAELFRALKCESQPASLGMLLYDLGLPGWNLHNAGNDAAYTLQALVAIALKGLLPKDERQSKDIGTRTDEAVMDAIERVTEENQEWVAAEGYDDGGPAEFKIEKPKDASTATSGRGAYRGGRGGRRGRGVGDQWRGGRGIGNPRGVYSG